jgi:hypothetical protein
MKKMAWCASRGKYISSQGQGHYYTRLEDGTVIEVHPDVYQQQFHAYLQHLGVKPTTFTEIIARAEQEWNTFCQVMNAFDEDVDQWRERASTQGVMVIPPTLPPSVENGERRKAREEKSHA